MTPPDLEKAQRLAAEVHAELRRLDRALEAVADSSQPTTASITARNDSVRIGGYVLARVEDLVAALRSLSSGG
jgi:hypothetical protein